MVGGILVGVGSAIAAALLINYFFVEPVHTLTSATPTRSWRWSSSSPSPALVSGAVELAVAARPGRRARPRRGGDDVGARRPRPRRARNRCARSSERARETFGMESVALKARERGSGEWVDVEHAGWAPPGEEAPLRFDVPVGPATCGWSAAGRRCSPRTSACCEAFAAAARTAYEGRRLSGEAEEARDARRPSTAQRTALLAAVGHDLRTPLAGIKAAVSSLRQTDVEWSDEERDELLATIEDSTDRLDAVVAQPARREPAQAGALSVQAEAGRARRGRRRRRCSRCPSAAERVERRRAEDLPLVQRRPRAAPAGARQRARQRAAPRRRRRAGRGRRPRRARRARSSRSSTTGRASTPSSASGCSSRSSGSTTAATEGVGLGLSVARGFVEAMGGAMVADHTPGGGLTMRIRLPLADADDGRRDPGPGRRGRARAAAGARDQPAGARLRGRRSPRTARAALAAASRSRRTRSCSTSGCRTSTASR